MIKIPFGLCDVTFAGKKLSIQADDAVFEAIPEYQNVFGGSVATRKTKYFLIDYRVEFTTFLNDENYETLMLHFPALKSHEHGLSDNPAHVNTEGERLIIHPKYTDSKEYDLVIWNAYISPEHGFKRTFGKSTDNFEVTFIGKPAKYHVRDLQASDGYFFIGDWTKIVGDKDD